MRQCGDCQLCCKLLPVGSLKKPANTRCQHQRHHKGCAVYKQLGRVSPECRLWNCRWLVNDDAADLSRPDRTHYVVDVMPDFVTVTESGVKRAVEVVQIWVDPKYPDAHRDPTLRAWLERRAKDGIIGLVRNGNDDAVGLIPPALSDTGQWIEHRSNLSREKTHSVEDVERALNARMVIHVA